MLDPSEEKFAATSLIFQVLEALLSTAGARKLLGCWGWNICETIKLKYHT